MSSFNTQYCAIFLYRKPLATCTNVPKTQWSFPTAKGKSTNANRIDGKENILESSSSSSSDSPSSICGQNNITHLVEAIPETPPWAVSSYKDKKKQSVSGMRCLSVKITPTSVDSCGSEREFSSFNQSCNSSIASPVFRVDEKKTSSILESSKRLSVNISSASVSHLSSKHESCNNYSNNSVLIQQNSTPAESSNLQLSHNESSSQTYSTSTPVIRANSRNSHFVTVRGGHAKNQLRQNQMLSLSDCQVFIEHLKLTPEQYNSVKSSLNEGEVSVGDLESNHNSISLNDNHVSIEDDGKNDSLLNNVFTESIDRVKTDKDTAGMPPDCESSNQSDLVSECVVSLEKLRLSPFKVNGRLDKKRLCVRVSLDNTGSSHSLSSICEDDGNPVTPPRNQISHISFLVRISLFVSCCLILYFIWQIFYHMFLIKAYVSYMYVFRML